MEKNIYKEQLSPRDTEKPTQGDFYQLLNK